MVIINESEILELLECEKTNHRICYPSDFETILCINDRSYNVVGAILSDGKSHYRCVVLIQGKFLEYDGKWKKMKWHKPEKEFTSGFYTDNMWYCLKCESSEGDSERMIGFGHPEVSSSIQISSLQ